MSSESNNQRSSRTSGGKTSNTTSNNSASNGRFKPPLLTETILHKHNEDMEKLMVQKHREQKKEDKRNKSSLNDAKVKDHTTSSRNDLNSSRISHTRPKRSRSQSRDDSNFKVTYIYFKAILSNYDIFYFLILILFKQKSKFVESLKLPQNITQTPAHDKCPQNNADPFGNVPKVNPSTNLWSSIPGTVQSTAPITHQCYPMPK